MEPQTLKKHKESTKIVDKDTNQQQNVIQLFSKQNPLSLNNKSIYRQDYESILNKNWLRTQVIGSLITIFEKMFLQKMEELVENELQNLNSKDFQFCSKNLKENMKNFVKVIDPFVVTMILTSQQDFILQTLQGLQIFNIHTKYILFPMNTQFWKGNHWFLSVFKNPRFGGISKEKQDQSERALEREGKILILNSIPSLKNDTSIFMGNELKQQLLRLLKLFHPDQKFLCKIRVHRIEKVTNQSNSHDCGIYTIAFIQEILFTYILENEITRILKLQLWRQFVQKSKQSNNYSEIDQNSQFLILKSSTYLRKYYRQLLEKEIMKQNSALLQ